MSVLLTGANGFVGSHTLERLLAEGIDVRILIRSTSDTSLIEHLLPRVKVCYGSLDDPSSLTDAVRGVKRIIHCAGKTKSPRPSGLYRANRGGTANLVDAAAFCGDSLEHFILISSLAVSGPGTVDNPAREDAPPAPVSHYGRSKRMAEEEVMRRCRAPWTILRPGPVYGPGDRDFCISFKPLARGILPVMDGGRMPICVIFGPDVARGIVGCLHRSRTFGKIYHLAQRQPVAAGIFLETAAGILGVRPRRIRIPTAALYPLCLALEGAARLTGRQIALNLDKLNELRAPGWVCAVDKIKADTGFEATTPLEEGLAATLDWYRRKGWL